ncbi:MAG: hypothetical protein Q9226_005526 [Calogaya cf. arnoldii]
MDSTIAPYQASTAANADDEGAVMALDERANPEYSRMKEPRNSETQSRNSALTWTRDSLDVLEKHHQTNEPRENSITAANVMLPESIEASSGQSFSGLSEIVHYDGDDTCWEEIHKLQKHMPHLKNVRKESRAHDQARIESFDYNSGNITATETHRFDCTTSGVAKDFAAAILDNIPADIDTRLLVIDDLSSKLLYVLRTCLGVSFEFFEEHLLNAGWHDDLYNDMRQQRGIQQQISSRTMYQSGGIDPFGPEPSGLTKDMTRKIFKFGASGRLGVEATTSTESPRLSGSHLSTQRLVREDTQEASSSEDICLFMGYSIRVPLLDYQDTLVDAKKRRLAHEIRTGTANSTTDALKQLLQPYGALIATKQTHDTLLEGLLMIIIHDTLKILRLIDQNLTQMDLDMLYDALVQVHVDDWRRELYEFQIELRSMESSIPEFADMVLARKIGSSNPGAAKGSRATRELLGRFRKEVTRAQGRTESTLRSLMTTMSLIESKRGISEAESVTKLTELAFFFIHLTFAASLFSMQVKELDGSTTSVGVFLAVALAITICSYSLRLVIRSSKFLSLWLRWKDEIRAEKGIRPSTPIATSAVLKWIWQHLHTHIWPVYMIIPMAALLAALWTRPLQEDMKTGITIALAMLCLATVLLMVSMRYGISEDWARNHRRRLAR